MPNDSPGIRILCSTKWTVRAQALQSILTNHEFLQMLWDELLEVVDTEMSDKVYIIDISLIYKRTVI